MIERQELPQITTEDGWEVVGARDHRYIERSRAQAEAIANWLGSLKRRSQYEYAAVTLANGTHWVARRRKERAAAPPA